jgi:hypothetical protein
MALTFRVEAVSCQLSLKPLIVISQVAGQVLMKNGRPSPTPQCLSRPAAIIRRRPLSMAGDQDSQRRILALPLRFVSRVETSLFLS